MAELRKDPRRPIGRPRERTLSSSTFSLFHTIMAMADFTQAPPELTYVIARGATSHSITHPLPLSFALPCLSLSLTHTLSLSLTRTHTHSLTHTPHILSLALFSLSLSLSLSLFSLSFLSLRSLTCVSNSFLQDGPLKAVLRRLLPAAIYKAQEADFIRFGSRVVRDIGRDADLAERYPPQLVHVRPWGQRVDEIQTHESWARLHAAAAEEGLIALGYERRHGAYSRLVQYCKVYLFAAVSIVSCPLVRPCRFIVVASPDSVVGHDRRGCQALRVEQRRGADDQGLREADFT